MSSLVPRDLLPGDFVGHYQLLCPVARGGMGQIWAARRSQRFGPSKLVAIKTALPQSSPPPPLLARLFWEEARVATAIDHPNVCRVHELVQSRGRLFLVMEWIDGASLSTLLAALGAPRRLEFRLAAWIVAQACAGLHAAHELRDAERGLMGVVHGDATPHNILISAAGEVKVVDFGIVESRAPACPDAVTRELRGKAAYLAPEQVLARNVDRRADIFTLGSVLYYATVGRRPFAGDSTREILHHIAGGVYQRPSVSVPDYPQALESIVVRALDPEPSDRFPTAEAMRRSLDALVLGGGSCGLCQELGQLLDQRLGPAMERRRGRIRALEKVLAPQSGQHRIGWNSAPPPGWVLAGRSARGRGSRAVP